MPNPMMEFEEVNIDKEAWQGIKWGCLGGLILLALPVIIYLASPH